MAGIGFELRRLLKKDTLYGSLQAYTYAGLISSGPWILSILAILILGVLSIAFIERTIEVIQFQTSVTSLIAFTLILSGFLQLSLNRFMADRLFEKNSRAVMTNLNGAILITTVVTGLLGLFVLLFFFQETTIIYRVCMEASFVLLSNIWLCAFLLSGLNRYNRIFTTFLIGYATVVGLGLLWRPFGLEGLIAGFTIGQFVLLMGMMICLYDEYPSNHFLEFDFVKPGRMFKALIAIGVIYNLAAWIDKIIFWFHPDTGKQIIGILHSSIIYDLPIFLAYLTIIPGMAIYLVRIETDFADYYDLYYDAIRDGGSLAEIRSIRNELVLTARQSIFEVLKIQTLTALIVFIGGPFMLELLGLSKLYTSLFFIDVIGVSLQVFLLVMLNVLFYLDKRERALLLVSLFLVLNFSFSLFSIYLGPYYYGYGFAGALLVASCVGLWLLDYDFKQLEYETFMLHSY